MSALTLPNLNAGRGRRMSNPTSLRPLQRCGAFSEKVRVCGIENLPDPQFRSCAFSSIVGGDRQPVAIGKGKYILIINKSRWLLFDNTLRAAENFNRS